MQHRALHFDFGVIRKKDSQKIGGYVDYHKNTISFANKMSDRILSELKLHSENHHFKKDETIIHKGQEIGGAYIVLSGTLRIFTMDLQGNEKPIYSLNAGEICIFSINCIFKRIVYPAWVKVDSKSANVLAIPTVKFKELYDMESSVRDYVLNSMSERIFDLMSSIEEVSIYDLGHRINSFLVRSYSSNQILHISHQDIATSLGTAREVVSRHLKLLEKIGYVELSRMKIKILLPEKLAEIPLKYTT